MLLMILPILANCQNRKIIVKNFEEGTIPDWISWRFGYSHQLGLQLVHDNENQYHFRFSTDKQLIEIYQEKEGSEMKGQIINWSKEYVNNEKEKPTKRFFHEEIILDSTQIQKVVQLIEDSQIKEVPDDESVKNWKKGFDGITYSIEFADKYEYNYKSYWTPIIQESVVEAEEIQKFVDDILKITNAEKIWNDFSKQIPFECYINYGPEITCKVLTWLEKKKYKKERRNYRQHSGGVDTAGMRKTE